MTREEAIKILSREKECVQQALQKCADGSGYVSPDGMIRAADYVEACSVALAALRDQQERGWISVEERLPEAEKEVRVLCKASWNREWRYQCQAFYEPKGMLREASNYGWDYECCSEYSEEDDDYFVNPGWYERIHNWDDYSAVGIADEVTHWMPLPEPPKEEV